MILGHKIVGQGEEKVMVLHDWFSDGRNYDSIIPLFDTTTYQFCFPDFGGYGRSRSITGQCTIDEAAPDIYHLADAIYRFLEKNCQQK
jgi:pimeloyl-ACP methyl ester carboxylesterase